MRSKLTHKHIQTFQHTIKQFYQANKRSFPWRAQSNTPYHILVSEIMLQQTQTDRVVPKYKIFVRHFPNFKQLSKATLAEVITHWQGLGYNRRAQNLHQCAQVVVKKYNSRLPREAEQLIKLPGIGLYTAAAIQAFAFNIPSVVIETNIRTVFLHHFFANKKNIPDSDLFPLIQQTLDTTNPREWYAALMDYGSYVKKTVGNLSRNSKQYTKQSTFKGSNRQARGSILKCLTEHTRLTKQQLQCLYPTILSSQKLTTALKQLENEQLIKRVKQYYFLAE